MNWDVTHPTAIATCPRLLYLVLMALTTSFLDYLRQYIIIDVDSMDPAVAAKHTGDVVRFCDMTSNQAIVFGEASRPERAVVLQAACQRVQGSDIDHEQQVTDALDILVRISFPSVDSFLTFLPVRAVSQRSIPVPYWACPSPDFPLSRI